MSPTWRGPETEPEGLRFHESLSEVARKRVSDELKANEQMTKSLFALKEGRFPEAEEMGRLNRFGLLTKLVDSQQGSLQDRLFDFKLDMVDFIETRIVAEGGSLEENRSKQWEYKQAMEKLFQAVGNMGPQQEYRLLIGRLGRAEMPKTPEERKRLEERRALMERRKKELEEVYGVKGRR